MCVISGFHKLDNVPKISCLSQEPRNANLLYLLTVGLHYPIAKFFLEKLQLDGSESGFWRQKCAK